MANIFDELLSGLKTARNEGVTTDPRTPSEWEAWRQRAAQSATLPVNSVDITEPDDVEQVNANFSVPDWEAEREQAAKTARDAERDQIVGTVLKKLTAKPAVSEDVSQFPPESVMSVDPSTLVSKEPSLEDEDLMMSVAPPMSKDEAGGVEMPPKKEVVSYEVAGRKEGRATKRRTEPSVAAPPKQEAPAEPAEDAMLKGYKDKASALEKDRMAALERAAAEKELSSEEKVAMALLAALPGLVGAIGGGAIAGGWGAAAGAAGGLQGGAQGIQTLNQSKLDRRKEARSDADTLLEQIGQQEMLATRRGEMLEGRALDEKKTAEQRKYDEAMLNKKLGADRANTMAQVLGMLKGKEIDARSDDYKAWLNAQAPTKQTEADTAYAQNAGMVLSSLDDLYNVIGEFGTKEIATPLSTPKTANAAAVLKTAPQTVATMLPKLLDPGTAAREGEVDVAKEKILNMGVLTSEQEAQASVKFLKDFVERHVQARQLAKQGVPADEIARRVGGSKYLPGDGSPDWKGPQNTQPAQSDWRTHPGITWSMEN